MQNAEIFNDVPYALESASVIFFFWHKRRVKEHERVLSSATTPFRHHTQNPVDPGEHPHSAPGHYRNDPGMLENTTPLMWIKNSLY